MRYILAFLLLMFIVAAFLFQSKSPPQLSQSQKELSLQEQLQLQKEEENENLADEKPISESAPTSTPPTTPPAESGHTISLNMKDEVNQASIEPVYKKKQEKKVKYIVQEEKEKLISSKLGDYFIQDHLQVISAQSYDKSQGQILAKSAGYYFIAAPKGQSTKSFPIVVKKKNKKSLKLMTGIISIKSKSQDNVQSIANKHSLKKVQFFKHLDLYIYKLSTPSNLIKTFKEIQQSPGINQATLEVLNKRVEKL